MNIIVRTKEKLPETLEFFKKHGRDVIPCAISRTTPQAIDVADDVEGFIVTSSAALLSIKQKKLPLFCVGHGTALKALDMGFRVAYAGNSDVVELAEYITAVFPIQKLLHVAGDIAGTDWYEILQKSGFEISQVIAYKTEFAQELAENVVSAINSGNIENILFFSALGAQTFMALAERQGLDIKDISVIALSQQVVNSLQEITKTATKIKIKIASSPNMESMVELISNN